MMRTLFTILCCLTVLLAQPGVAEACIGAEREDSLLLSDDGEGYYQFEDRLFKRDEKNEFNYQRYPNIVLAKLTSVVDAAGTNKFEHPDSETVFPLTYNFAVQRVLKGDLEGSFKVEASAGSWAFSTCAWKIQYEESDFLLYLPEKHEARPYGLYGIVRHGKPSRKIRDRGGEKRIQWLEKRALMGVPLNDQGEEVSHPKTGP